MPTLPQRCVLLLLVPLLVALSACDRPSPIERVRALQASGRHVESIEPLRELLETGPGDPEVLYLYGVALAADGQPALALWALEEAMQDPEWLVPAGLLRARNALSIASHDAAVAAATRVLEAEPDNLAALGLRARARVESRHDYEGAIEDADRVLEAEPDNLGGRVSRAVAFLALGRVEEADAALAELEESFRQAELGPELTSRYCFVRVEFAKERGDLELAEERLSACIAEHPSAAVGVTESVAFFDETGQLDRSMEVLRDALEEQPDQIEYRTALASRLRASGRGEEALALLREATEAEAPGARMNGWVALGEYNLADDQPNEAAQALERALELGGDSDLLFMYAGALISAERFSDALAVAERMPVPAYAALIRARAYQAQGRPEEALAYFDEGLLLWPNSAVARYYAARAAEELGLFDRAIEEYRYALRADPAAADTRWRLAKLHRAEGRLADALEVVLHSWNRSPGGVELELLWLEIAAQRGGRAIPIQSRLQKLGRVPALRAPAAAAVAEGLRRGERLDLLFEFIGSGPVDLRSSAGLPLLRVLVAALVDADRAAEALERADAAAGASPGSAPFQALRGDALAALGRGEEAREAFERAGELDPESAAALAGLARLASDAGDAAAALELYQRVAALDSADVPSRLAASRLLLAAGRAGDARELLDQVLEVEPYDPEAAMLYARVELAADPASERARVLAQRAARFGGGEPARDLLESLEGPEPLPTPAAAAQRAGAP